MERIFITGGAGFIGSHTVDRAIADGFAVTVYDRKSWEEATNLHQQQGSITYVQGDILDYELLQKSMSGHSRVLHLAAVVSVQETIHNPLYSHAVNVTGTLNVFEAARASDVTRVVYASSAAVYGKQEVTMMVEDLTCAPLSPYGLHKLINDEYATLATRLHGQSMLGLRYFNVYGTRQSADSPYSGVISLFAGRVATGAALIIYGDGSATRDFISVTDVAEANVRALFSEAVGYCNIASGVETSINTLIDTIEYVTGTSIVRDYKDGRAGDILRSSAATALAKKLFGFEAKINLEQGLSSLLSTVQREQET
jgi:UDP-glucose 4-epimerase